MNLSPRLSLPRSRIGMLLSMLLLGEVYFVAAEIGIYFHASAVGSPGFVWPAAGIAMAGLYLGGTMLWPGVLIASFVSLLLAGQPLPYAIGLAVANALQGYIGACILTRFRIDSLLARVRDIFALSMAAFFATLIVPTTGLLLQALLFLPGATGFGAWFPWWLGEVLSVIILVPFLIRWIPNWRVDRTPLEWVEILAALASLAAVDYVLFFLGVTSIGGVPLAYLIFFPLMWIALRIGPRFMTLALFLNAVLILIGTFVGPVTTPGLSLGTRIFNDELFLIFFSVMFLILVTIAEERKNNANALMVHIARLENAIERAGKEDEAKSQFIATLAHELRNPLAPLMSALEVLKLMGNMDGVGTELVQDMTEHIRTMRHLLDDLLDISRIAQQKFNLRKEQVDLHTLVHQSVRTISVFINERNHTLTLSLPTDKVVFEADPVRLEQILVNVLNNAAKYTNPGGRIEVEALVEGDSLILRVRDNGIGIPATDLEHIFEPFHQGRQHSDRTAGIGIGLALTRSLVEMHGGTIIAESAGLGRGSQFSIRLPFIPPETESDMESILPVESATESYRILVVDDNRSAAEMLKKLLTLRGHHVDVAYSGGDALALLTSMTPDIVILDIGLPDIDGYAVARAIRTHAYPIRLLIALSGYGQDEDKKEAQEAGFDVHLTKPIGLAELEETFASLR